MKLLRTGEWHWMNNMNMASIRRLPVPSPQNLGMAQQNAATLRRSGLPCSSKYQHYLGRQTLEASDNRIPNMLFNKMVHAQF